MKEIKASAHERGQVLLIVILIMVVTMTVGLSVVTRTVTNLRTANEEESSERAFSAAEAGIERALSNTTSTSGSFANDTTYNTVVGNLSGVEFLLQNGIVIPKDESADVWLSTYPTYANPWSGSLTLYWGSFSDVCAADEETNTLPALSVSVLSGSLAAPSATYYAFDTCAPRAAQNNFELITPGNWTIGGKQFRYRRTITIASGMFARVTPLYASGVVGVRGCNVANTNCLSLPSQGSVIESVGVADDTQRKIISFRGYPKIPTELFPYVLFAPR